MINKYICLPYRTVHYKITTDCTTLINDIELLYGQYVLDKSNNDFIELKILKDKKDNYVFSYREKVISTDNPLQLIKNMLFKQPFFSLNIISLHGAAVEYQKKAYIFLASTTTGKTTLTSYLTEKGFKYITDDCILIDRSNLNIIPSITPIHLRNGGYDVLKSCNSKPSNVSFVNNKTIKRYVYTPTNYIKSPIPFSNIYFIYRNEKENKLLNLSLSQSIAMLLKSLITPSQIKSEYMKTVCELAKKKCQKLYYKDMEYVYKLIFKDEGA